MHFGQLIGFFALVVSIYILWQIRQILLLIFAAVVLATVLNQLVQFLQKHRIKRGIAVAITVCFLLIIIASFLIIIIPSLLAQLQQFIKIMPRALERLRFWSDWLQNIIPEQFSENFRVLTFLTQGLQNWLNQLVKNLFSLVSSSLSMILGLLLFLALTIMLLADPLPYRQGFILLFPAFYRRRVDEILSECATSLTGWIKGTLLTMLIIAVLSYIGLLILQVPLPLVNAVLAGLLEFIPNIGPTLSVIPPAVLALSDVPWKAAAVVALYFGIQQVESLVVVPWIMQSQVSLLPAVTLTAVVIFGSFFGFLGVFLAIPLVIVLQIWVKEVLIKDVLNNWHENKQDRAKHTAEVENHAPHSSVENMPAE